MTEIKNRYITKNGRTVVEEIEVEEKGFELLQDDTIKCADCGIPLISIIKVREDDTIQKRIKAVCTCGGESYMYEIKGDTYMQAVEGLAIEDMPMDIIDNIMNITIKVIKQ